jgi:DNA-directed RNA polymerase I, II, and III subunit RPABC5
MLIPVKCFTCGEVLADKYRWYQIEVRKMKMSNDMTIEKVVYLTKETTDKTPEGQVMDKLKLDKYCCRRHMLTHVDIN